MPYKILALFDELSKDQHPTPRDLSIIEEALYHVGELTREARAPIFVPYALVSVALSCAIDLEAVYLYRVYAVVVRLCKVASVEELAYLRGV